MWFDMGAHIDALPSWAVMLHRKPSICNSEMYMDLLAKKKNRML